MKAKLSVLLALPLCGCGGGKLVKEQKAQIETLQKEKNALLDDLTRRDKELAAAGSEKAELEGRANELNERLAASRVEVDSLKQSNESLTKSLDASKGELAGQLAKTITEKDKLAKKLSELFKEKGALERRRAETAAKLSLSKQAADSYERRLAAADAEAKAAAAKAQADREARLLRAREELGALADAVLKELESELVSAEQKGDVVELTLREAALFEPQKAKLTDAGLALLDRLAQALRRLPRRPLRVEGHTDNAALKRGLLGGYPSLWDLSAARAVAVARRLQERAALDPRQLTASGFGEFRPVKSNATPEGRAANNRVVLVLEPAP